MTTGYNDLSQYDVGTETVEFRETDSAAAVSVAQSLCGPLGYKGTQFLQTIGVNPLGIMVKLPKSALGSAVPLVGQSRIDRTNGEQWRVQSAEYSHVYECYVCTCSEAR